MDLLCFLLGIALVIVGGYLFLDNITVSGLSGGWFSMASRLYVGTNTITVIVIMMVFCFVVMVVKPNFITKTLMAVTAVLFVFAIILSLRFNFKPTSAFVTFAMLASIFGGLALILKVSIGTRKKD